MVLYLIYLWQGQWLSVRGTVLSVLADIDAQKRAYLKLNIVNDKGMFQVIPARSFYVSDKAPEMEPWEESKTPPTL